MTNGHFILIQSLIPKAAIMNYAHFDRPSPPPTRLRVAFLKRSADDDASLLTPDQEVELARRIRTGDHSARDQLISANQRLVRRIAQEFRRRGSLLDVDDLVQEGNLGLLRATRDFAPEAHGARFATYASCWIRYSIQRAIAEYSSAIRVPYYLFRLRRRFDRERERLIQDRRADLGSAAATDPKLEEVAELMQIDSERLQSLLEAKVDHQSFSMASTDLPSSEEMALARLIPPEAPLEIAESMERLYSAMRKLTLLESWIIRRRYRLDESFSDPDSSQTKRRRRPAGSDRPSGRSDGRRSYNELARETGRPAHQLRVIERNAISKLYSFLDPSRDERLPMEDVERPSPIGTRRSA